MQSVSKSTAPKYDPYGIREFSFEINSKLQGSFHACTKLILKIFENCNDQIIVQFSFNTVNTDKQH